MPAYKCAKDFPRPPHLLTVQEASEISGLCPQTLRKYIKLGWLGSVKRSWRYGIYKRQALFIPIQELRLMVLRRLGAKFDKFQDTIEYRPVKVDESTETVA